MADKKDENLEVDNQKKEESTNDNELTVEQLKEKYDLSSKEAVRQKNINKAIVQSAKDPKSLLEVDEKVAQSVLDQMYDGISLEEYKAKFGLNSEPEQVDVDKIVEQKLNKAKVNEKLEHIKNQLPDQFKSKFDEEFNDLTEWKNLTPQNADKYIKLTISTLQEWDDKGVLNQVRQSSIAGKTSSKKVSEKTKEEEKRVKFAEKLIWVNKQRFRLN